MATWEKQRHPRWFFGIHQFEKSKMSFCDQRTNVKLVLRYIYLSKSIECRTLEESIINLLSRTRGTRKPSKRTTYIFHVNREILKIIPRIFIYRGADRCVSVLIWDTGIQHSGCRYCRWTFSAYIRIDSFYLLCWTILLEFVFAVRGIPSHSLAGEMGKEKKKRAHTRPREK